MRVRVYAPAFCDDSLLDEKNWIDLKEGATVRSLLKLMRTPIALQPIILLAVNYQRVRKNYVLHEGDTLSILGPLSSG